MRKLFLSLVFLSALLSIHANPGIKGIVIDQTTLYYMMEIISSKKL